MKKIKLKNVQTLTSNVPNSANDSGEIMDSGVVNSGVIISGEAIDEYTIDEFLELVLQGCWKGGFVNGVYTEAMNEIVVTPDENGETGSGSNGGGTFNIGGGNSNQENTGNGNTNGESTKSQLVYDNNGKQIYTKDGISVCIMKNAEYLSSYTINLLLNLSGYNGKIVITSTARTPREQAKAMLYNIKLRGVSTQLAIYKEPGQKVIRVYSPLRSDQENIDAMEQKILEVGPSAVSHHCCDFSQKNVFDISKNSTSNIEMLKNCFNFVNVCYLDENGCYHVEIDLP